LIYYKKSAVKNVGRKRLRSPCRHPKQRRIARLSACLTGMTAP
jgi:hypothetical protein